MEDQSLKPIAMSQLELDMLFMILESADPIEDYYFDLETGQALPDSLFEDVLGPDVDPEDERFIPLEPADSSDGFRVMQEFAQTAPMPEDFRARLFDALDRPKPFRRFRDELHQREEVLEAFDAFKSKRLLDAFQIELAYHGYMIVKKEES